MFNFEEAPILDSPINPHSNSVLTNRPDIENINTITLPEHIKKNFIYRKVWKEVWRNDSNATFILIGKPGSGKSVIAQKMCIDLDPTFNHDRICYDVDGFLKLLDEGDRNGKLKAGNCILFDEIITDKGADSRSAMSKTNKLMNYITATFRAKRLIVFYCLPSLMQLDKNIRDINVTGIFEVLKKDTIKRKNLCKFQWSNYDARTQKVYGIFPRLMNKKGQIQKVTGVWIGLPEKDFENIYKKKKMEYLNNNISRWYNMSKKENTKKTNDAISDKDIMIKINLEKEKYIVGGKYNGYKIKQEFGLGISRANQISGYLNKSNIIG